MNRIAWVSAPLVAVLLSACEPGTTFIPRVAGIVDVTDIKMQPEVFRWQKQGQFGNTDSAQRKEDMIECGVHERYNFESPVGAIGLGTRPGETTKEYVTRRDKFWQCMEDKNYVQLGLSECGPVKENRGICK